jgi:type I restriction enzyme S subunit
MSTIEGWETRRFSDLLNVVRNGFAGNQCSAPTAYPVSRIETIADGHIDLKKTGYVLSIPTSYLLRAGDILFSNINSVKHIGKIAYVEPEIRLFHGMNLLLFRLCDEVDSKFAYYKLISKKKWFESMSAQAINQASINQSTVRELELDIPESLPEQAKIAEVLSTVDRAIAQTEALIAKQQRIKTGLMADLLTREIDADGNLRSEATHAFKDSPLGRIPVEWEVKRLDEYGDVVTGNTPSTSDPLNYDGPFLFASPADISGSEDFIRSADKTLTLQGYAQCRKLPLGAICVVCIGSTIGKIAMTVEPCTTNQQINSIIPFVLSDSELLFFLMKRSLPFQLRKEAGLQAVPIVNKSNFSSLILAVPSSAGEKSRIKDALASSSNENEALVAQSEKLRSLKTALMQDLLTGKKRVTDLLNTEVTG